ncbi:GspH/FimT family pseudopilin [Xanthomonas cucurbitae]|uniref:Type II secretion system protein H n=1 Tax=Xanthomonas cucurbitae TaxID=56453 RepID=A0A2S7DVA7_9XANT|nr:GspH/FimT family pseudopilin [Xanthomonas cucurbitae]PPU77777.1 type II secretion system protein GspH [Xanthomonas cucurbitae]WDM67068.1 GspH/FimT family pseudopilin [Xanthomonas cucurbitae]WDM70946.1 GspH/FimT family pseudopilin [Xanthomonas cucurbitae]WDM79780.1 GspH/FimT family pseudopilin [Xanthomonas cucurbitae]WDM83474.1 GspH/FimT family pseudopilin [Xanthomonas cucurbitae]
MLTAHLRLQGCASRHARAGVHGFTLLEVLAVLVITALASTLVVMTLPDTRRDLHDQADALASALVNARDEAILSLRMVEVIVDTGGYTFRRQARQQWVALDEKPFAATRWPAGVQAELPAGATQLSVRFDPTGAATPQRIALADGQQQLQVLVDAAGGVRVDAPHR